MGTDDSSHLIGPDGGIDLPIPHPPAPPLFGIEEFNMRLREWLTVERSRTVGVHPLTSALVLVGHTLCRLAQDTTRAGVYAYLDRVSEADGLYSVVHSSQGVAYRVVPGRSADRIRGFYMYTQDAFDDAQVIQPVTAPMDHWSVAMLILEAVADLHGRGHQRLRIYPNISGSGMHWRTLVVDIDDLRLTPSGWPSQSSPTFAYSTASRFTIGGIVTDVHSTPTEIADRILTAFPDPRVAGRGQDWAYAGWYVEMLGLAQRHREFPVSDEITVGGHRIWSIGSQVRIDEPPPFEVGPSSR